MPKPLLQIGRNLSQHRITAYECIVHPSGFVKGKRVTGWYGMFHEERLKKELLPKLAEHVKNREATYPFLITSYMLESKTDVWVEGHRKRAKASDVKFRPRRKNTAEQYEAVVHSPTKYQILR